MSNSYYGSDTDDAWCTTCAVAWPYYAMNHPGGTANTCTGSPSASRPECTECWGEANEEQGALTLAGGELKHEVCR